MNKVAVLVFGSLILLSSAFAAAPWSQMAQAGVSGYVDSASSGVKTAER
jgi:hypothetical protein